MDRVRLCLEEADMKCVLCGMHTESVDHLFFLCDFSLIVLSKCDLLRDQITYWALFF